MWHAQPFVGHVGLRPRTCVLFLSVLALASCAHRGPRSFETVAPPPGPHIRGAQNGLEVLSWIVEDSAGSIGRTLAPISLGTPLPAADAEQWRRAGLRLIAIPEDRIETLRAELHDHFSGTVQRQWYGLMPRWTPVVKGPTGTASASSAPSGWGPAMRPRPTRLSGASLPSAPVACA